MTYYNTTVQFNPALAKFKSKAMSQDAIILDFFKKKKGRRYTPFSVLELSDLPYGTPITSVRRSLNTLTEAGHLVKLDELSEGKHGRPNHVWTLKNI